VKEAQKAEREAEKQRPREERDRQKALETSQKGKRKASKALPKPKKKQTLSGDGSVSGSMGGVAEQACYTAAVSSSHVIFLASALARSRVYSLSLP
jgi:hypothetical protein